MDIQKLQKYWHDRALEEEKKVYDLTKNQIELQEKLYSEAKRKIDTTINFYTNKFMKNNQVDYIKAKELLTKDELKEFRWTLSNYINNSKKKDLPLQEYVKLQKQLTNSSLKHRIDKLEAMKHEINMQLNELARTKELMVEEHLSKVYEEQYYKNLYNNAIATHQSKYISSLNPTQIQNVVKSNWLSDGSNFSSIIWKNKEKLLSEMQKTITVGVITGKTPYDLSKDFARVMKVDRNRATVLLQTESARVRSMAEIESYKQMGVSKYQIIATLDDRTSDICQSMDMKIFDTKDYEVGVTAPPFHPNCRSTKAPYYEDSLITDNGRIARGESNKNVYVPSDMTYKEWKQEYIIDHNEILNRYNKIKEIEPIITKSMKEITKQLELKLVGLEYRLKTLESTLRKVTTDSKVENISKLQAFNKLKDIVRYTIELPEDNFYNKYLEVKKLLKQKGYAIIKVKNSWEDDSPYKGINTILKKDDLYFEMQYHTKKSLEVKEINHKLYEEKRLDTTSEHRKNELDKIMIKNSKTIPNPKGVELIK
jgi:hypothetical protein